MLMELTPNNKFNIFCPRLFRGNLTLAPAIFFLKLSEIWEKKYPNRLSTLAPLLLFDYIHTVKLKFS